ncbi:type II toxin-antitoxin system VapC family toxin [Spiribacter sp. 1M153]|uniref:Ribonuclease VapC n=1 Tax=Spiribacter roseus TaxID=1855875 RepID=A0ABV3RZC8_9GAMM|nr:type II toxin-antitoxin system VapC family toxin [Spiribacter sp. SSL99]KAF0285024.1 transcriptional regulator [Spiribacter sp. SSL99]
MARSYLLDTNIISALVRHPHGSTAQKIIDVGGHAVCTSIVVSSELQFGARKAGSERLQKQVDAVLSAIEILPLDQPVDVEYAKVRHHLESNGSVIGPNDMLIGAHARSLGMTVVTANEREFRRIPGLMVENWLG